MLPGDDDLALRAVAAIDSENRLALGRFLGLLCKGRAMPLLRRRHSAVAPTSNRLSYEVDEAMKAVPIAHADQKATAEQEREAAGCRAALEVDFDLALQASGMGPPASPRRHT